MSPIVEFLVSADNGAGSMWWPMSLPGDRAVSGVALAQCHLFYKTREHDARLARFLRIGGKFPLNLPFSAWMPRHDRFACQFEC
jgi:hypothetical protein